MATATADAALTAGAASAGGAGSSGAASGGAGGGSGDGGGAVLTDDAILGITEESGDTGNNSGGSGGAGGAGTAAATQQTQQTQPTQQTAAAGGQAAPAELTIDQFKPLFGREIPITDEKGNVVAKIPGSQIQSLWDKFTSANGIVTQFGTVAEAREAAATIQAIGGVKELATLATKASGGDQTDAVFYGGSKTERESLVDEWYASGGQQDFARTSKGIAEMTEVTLDRMFERDKPNYQRIVGGLTRRALASVGFDRAVAAVRAAKESGEGVDEAVQQFLELTEYYGLGSGGRGEDANSPEARRLAAEREQFERDKSNFSNSTAMAVINAADEKAGTALVEEIERSLGDMKINGRPVFGEKSKLIKARLAKDIRAEVDSRLAKYPIFVQQVRALKATGLVGREQELVDLTMRHARLLLPEVVNAIVGPWTESVVSQAQGAADRARAGSTRTEVSGGAASAGGTKERPFTVAELKKKGGYGQLSDEDILNA